MNCETRKAKAQPTTRERGQHCRHDVFREKKKRMVTKMEALPAPADVEDEDGADERNPSKYIKKNLKESDNTYK